MANELDLIAAMTNAHLTDFDGKSVVRARVGLFGTDGLSEAMAVNPMEIPQGSEGVLVVRWVCAEVKHKAVGKDTPDLLTRDHRLKVLTVAFVENKAVTKILDEQEETIRKAREKARGIEALKSGDGVDPIGTAEKADKARKRGEKPAPVEPGVTQSGTFKGEPFDPEKEKARATRTRTPAATKVPTEEAAKVGADIVKGRVDDANVHSLDEARKAANGNDG